MLVGEGLQLTAKSAGVRFSGSQRSVITGPFSESKDLVAGFWIWKVGSLEEAIEWAKRCPNPHNTEDTGLEIRPPFEIEAFGDAATPEVRQQEKRLREQLSSKSQFGPPVQGARTTKKLHEMEQR